MLSLQETIDTYKIGEHDWERERKLSFSKVAILILRGHKHSMQNSLNKFFVEMEDLSNLPTASAYCQARDKLHPLLYKEMSDKSVSDFYRLYEGGKTWNGRRILGLDCSKLNLLNTKEIKEKYNTKINQTQKGNQCISSFLYDIFNEQP